MPGVRLELTTLNFSDLRSKPTELSKQKKKCQKFKDQNTKHVKITEKTFGD